MSGHGFSLPASGLLGVRLGVFLGLLLLCSPVLAAARPSVSQALELKPLQSNVDYDTPSAAEMEKCSLKSEVQGGVSGWVVLNAAGQPLRRFLDTNNDNKVDMWCYYKDGMEVYRDLDTDYDGKTDQYRWLNTAGTRWGLDPDQDGRINSWKMISPEEVSAEVVAALRHNDAARFLRLLPAAEEIASLGLGEKQRSDLTRRVEASRSGFATLASTQKIISPAAEWLQFGATRPGVVPAGTEGSTKDLMVYDNAAAIVATDGQHGQLVVGTLIQVGLGWRVVDLPKSEVGDGFFFASVTRPRQSDSAVTGGFDEQTQKLLGSLEAVDKALAAAPPAERPKLHAQRAALIEQIAAQAQTDAERHTWMRQYIDTIGAAVQVGEFPGGIARLKTLSEQIQADPQVAALVPHVRFTCMSAEYNEKIQQPNVDFAKLQEQWLKDLDAFVNQYPKAEESAEAMLQLAIAEEFAGQDENAVKWYGRILNDFPDAGLAVKAAGAKRRLECVGKSLTLRGKTLSGTAVDLDQYRGRIVLVHYWATWCEPCKRDLTTLKALQAKHAKTFSLIGVSLDSDARNADQFVRSQQMAWPQLYESGGLDSRLANELGILTLPTMILIDKTGRVVRRNVHIGELEAEIEQLSK